MNARTRFSAVGLLKRAGFGAPSPSAAPTPVPTPKPVATPAPAAPSPTPSKTPSPASITPQAMPTATPSPSPSPVASVPITNNAPAARRPSAPTSLRTNANGAAGGGAPTPPASVGGAPLPTPAASKPPTQAPPVASTSSAGPAAKPTQVPAATPAQLGSATSSEGLAARSVSGHQDRVQNFQRNIDASPKVQDARAAVQAENASRTAAPAQAAAGREALQNGGISVPVDPKYGGGVAKGVAGTPAPAFDKELAGKHGWRQGHGWGSGAGQVAYQEALGNRGGGGTIGGKPTGGALAQATSPNIDAENRNIQNVDETAAYMRNVNNINDVGSGARDYQARRDQGLDSPVNPKTGMPRGFTSTDTSPAVNQTLSQQFNAAKSSMTSQDRLASVILAKQATLVPYPMPIPTPAARPKIRGAKSTIGTGGGIDAYKATNGLNKPAAPTPTPAPRAPAAPAVANR